MVIMGTQMCPFSLQSSACNFDPMSPLSTTSKDVSANVMIRHIWNHISKSILLCGPCNGLMSSIYTLIGLRRENNQRGYMAT